MTVPTPVAQAVRAELDDLADPEHAKALARFFQTGPGGYGEGDVFHGVRAPDMRRVGRRHRDTASWDDLADLLADPVHERRFTALTVLDDRARRAERRGDLAEQRRLAEFYLANLDGVNSWDLVDVSAPHVLGGWLAARAPAALGPDDARDPAAREVAELLGSLAAASGLWHRRVAVLATLAFTRDARPGWALAVCERLVDDREDLLHKAVGWMLREAGRVDEPAMLAFLDAHEPRMARVAVRYALERTAPETRARYVSGRRTRRRAPDGA